jgi:hypothetical protein
MGMYDDLYVFIAQLFQRGGCQALTLVVVVDRYIHLPTQGWMFVPLDQYHAGGADASFFGHDIELEWALAQVCRVCIVLR